MPVNQPKAERPARIQSYSPQDYALLEHVWAATYDHEKSESTQPEPIPPIERSPAVPGIMLHRHAQEMHERLSKEAHFKATERKPSLQHPASLRKKLAQICKTLFGRI